MDDIRKILNYEEAEKSILTFGDYDRLKINVVNEFSRYRDLSMLAKCWIGNRQSILLYELDDTSPFTYVENENEYGFVKQETGEFDNHLFFALTEFNFRNEKHKDEKYEDLLQNATKYLKEIIELEGKNIEFMLLGSLGTFGIAVLWFCDQCTEILHLVNCIRTKHGDLFWAAHTTFSKNQCAENRADYEEKIREIDGKAFLQITLKEPINKLNVLKEYGISQFTHTAGEYDIIIDLEMSEVYRNFEKIPIFDHDKDEYQSLFLQTHVVLGESLEELEEKEITEYDRKSFIKSEDLNEVDNIYKEIRNLIEENIDKTAGLIDTLDSLLCDYRYNVVAADNESWAEDFSYIFYKNLQCIKEILQMKEQCSGVFMEVLRFIMNNLKQQIFHVAEASMLNFEIPKCHLRYTGQEDSILFCYMGIIKEILEYAYSLESVNRQTEIIPLVTVDVVPVIESDLYFDKICYVQKYEEDQEFKILSLNLPHVTFYNIPEYMQYMYHEVYHYIVPKNRESRDFNVGILLTIFHYSNIVMEYLIEVYDENREKAGRINQIIQPYMYMYICKIYPKIHQEIIGKPSEEVSRNAVIFVAEMYKECLLDYLRSPSGYQVWKEGLQYVWEEFHEKNKDIFTGEDRKIVRTIKEFFTSKEDSQRKVWDKYYNREDFLEFLNKIMEAVKEISADIPMIRLSKMPLEEYLIFYSNCLKNNLVNPAKIDLRDEMKELIRLGMIFNVYKEAGENIENIKDLYRQKYVAKYLTYTKKDGKNLKEKMSVLYQEAENWLIFFEKVYDRFVNQCKLFIPQYNKIIKEIDIKNRVSKYETEDDYFEKYRIAYKKYALKVGKIWDLCLSQNDADSIDEKYRDAKDEFKNALFQENICLFHRFQSQRSLKEISKDNEKHNEKKETREFKIPKYVQLQSIVKKPSLSIAEYTVYEMSGFWDAYMRIAELIENDCRKVLGESHQFWYRGQDNSKYGLLPSIMRGHVKLQGKVNYLSQYQRKLFEEFKYRADGSPEIMDRSFFNVSDYLTLMPHYSVSTTLMDWSEDIFTALYFAVEKVMNDEVKDIQQDAAVFVFSPHLYNEARKYMMKNDAGKTACTEAAFRASMKTIEGFDSGIPNIATKYNEALYDIFLLGNIEYESLNPYGYSQNMELSGQQEMAYLPVAIYTSRLNPRIRSQSGIFVAYNLYAEPSEGTEAAYKYMELERIQNYYIKECKRSEGKAQFLYKIILDKDGIKEIANSLSKMGVSKERIYPELSNIGERVTHRV